MNLAIEIIGWMGFTTSLLMLLPQVFKVIKTRDTKSLSLFMFILTFLNALIWFSFGLLTKSMQLYIANACAMTASIIIIVYIIINLIKSKKPQ
ncbi:SemiSWEET family sugar transporter [Spiroplasma turonicum]|uniref:MtN3 and saliva related transmembrane protein n=1 Tax=Spiroplasma turonicum TaxID=216946 RepID=A0A0K1P6U2_9MOLU|nr:SemiSWEET family transporter [Spiroplasma turonicum]AKU79990.1 hypothetical protein STURON_00744 [Spiroplasma turonicum]ALX70992.1 hypothetical protein STURO_v1c07410 [Spiroplasma turonicum]